MMANQSADSQWKTFIEKLEIAEEEFVQGQPAAFKSLWSRSDDVTLCGGFGGIEQGWQNVTQRLDWVSQKFADGTRTRDEISGFVGPEFAYLVQNEVINFRVPGQSSRSIQELRATMVFRREDGEWRIVHRHADPQTVTKSPP
jgi:ketosteroid isomerase-like protein